MTKVPSTSYSSCTEAADLTEQGHQLIKLHPLDWMLGLIGVLDRPSDVCTCGIFPVPGGTSTRDTDVTVSGIGKERRRVEIVCKQTE